MVYEMRGRLIKTENIYTRRFEAEKQFLKSQRNKGAKSFWKEKHSEIFESANKNQH